MTALFNHCWHCVDINIHHDSSWCPTGMPNFCRLSAICEWSIHAKFHFRKLLQQSDCFHLWFFISHKISWCNIVWSKHTFSCLRGDTLPGNTLLFPCAHWPCIFWSLLFAPLILLVHATVFTKPTVTRDLFDVQTFASACWKDNELQNICASSEFQ